jgi:hypothetical protein
MSDRIYAAAFFGGLRLLMVSLNTPTAHSTRSGVHRTFFVMARIAPMSNIGFLFRVRIDNRF